jgi:hypothetical protein
MSAVLPASVGAAASPVHFSTTGTTYTLFPNCQGGFVSGPVKVFVQGTAVQDAAGGVHVHMTYQLTGELVSGTTQYRFVRVQPSTSYTQAGGFPATGTFNDQILAVSEGSAPNAVVDSTLHVTVNANGDVTADVEQFVFECHG